MKNFKYPLAIEGSKEELEALIPKLEELGYVHWYTSYYSKGDYLCTNVDGVSYKMGFLPYASAYKRSIIPVFNSELVLALAACVDDSKCYVGEYWNIDGIVAKVTEVSSEGWLGNFLMDIFYTGYNKRIYTNYFSPNAYSKLSKEEIINHFNKQPMEKKIIGYKLIKEYPHSSPLNTLITPELTAFTDVCPKYAEFWEPVYEPEKPKVEIVTLRCEGGSFEVEVSKEGIYYRPENKFLDRNALNVIVKGLSVSGYHFKPVLIDSGCKKQVPREDWEKVLEVYHKFKTQ